ncbi:MAG: sulfite exporter TauE/SafE family protein [Spirochaetales bacterium]|nr:sulfite exporter TauE/SafE family protein [Spirochaetales bacterium]
MELLVLSLLSLAGSFVLGVTGFGFGVVLMGLFPLVIGFKAASVLVACVGLPVVLYLLIPLGKHIEWKALLRLAAGLLVGTPLGVWVLIRVSERYLTIALGVLLILYLAYDRLSRVRTNHQLPRFVGYLAGLIGGTFGGAFNTNGPPAVAYLSSLRLEKHAAQATIVAYIAIAALYKVGFLIYRGMISRQVLLHTLVLVGPAFGGMFLGRLVFKSIPAHVFDWAVQGLLAAIAVLMIVQAIRG